MQNTRQARQLHASNSSVQLSQNMNNQINQIYKKTL